MEQVPKPKRRRTDVVRTKPIVLAFIVLALIFFGTLVGFAWVINNVNNNSIQLTGLVADNRRLVKANNDRIADIQKARIESCQQTYGAIGEVFKPFFPPPPRTPEQQKNLDTLNETINVLQKGCSQQTGQE